MKLEQLQNTLKTASTVFWVDPPMGWAYGFPKEIDLSKETLTEEWLVEKGYSLDNAEFALKHIRMWTKE